MGCENCKKLRKKIRMLEKLEGLVNVSKFDLNTLYKEILEGCDEGFGIDPDPEFAKWFARRYGVENV